MNIIKSIRTRIGVSQSALANGLGCTQGAIGHYEKGRTLPPEMAKKLIGFAAQRGCALSFNDIYMPELPQVHANQAQPATESVAQGV